MLVKDIATLIDALPVVGSPGSPAVPGHWEAYTVATPTYQNVCYMESGSNVAGKDGNVVCYMVSKTVEQTLYRYVPGSPAVPATPGHGLLTHQTFNLGWNSGARSVQSLAGDGFAVFSATVQSAGIVVGFCARQVDDGYATLQHAFMFAHGIAYVYENGAQQARLGAFAAADTFRVQRLNGQVTYYQNDTRVYTSQQPSAGPVFVAASLYAGGDTLTDARLNTLASPRATLDVAVALRLAPAATALLPVDVQLAAPTRQNGVADGHATFAVRAHLTGLAGKGVAAQARLAVAATLAAAPASGAAVALRPLTGLTGNRPYGMSAAALAPLTVFGGAGQAAPPYALGLGVLPFLTGAAGGMSGSIGGSHTALAALGGLTSDHNYATAGAALAPLAVVSGSPGRLVAFIGPQAGARDAVAASLVWTLALDASADLASLVSAADRVLATLSAAAAATGDWTVQQVLTGLLQSHGLLINGLNLNGTVYDGWVMNMNSHAYTRYENYHFNSFACVNGQYLAAADDGLYLLDGNDDAGDPINASILLGKSDYRSPYKKRLPNAYFGIQGDGQMVLRVWHDTDTPQTFVFRPGNTLSGRRVKLAHGLESRYWQLQLANADGSDFSLDSIELLPVVLSRRI